jgi:hypothetical protein
MFYWKELVWLAYILVLEQKSITSLDFVLCNKWAVLQYVYVQGGIKVLLMVICILALGISPHYRL